MINSTSNDHMGLSGQRMFISVDTSTEISGCNVRIAAWEVLYRSYTSSCRVSLQVWKVVDAGTKKYKLVGQNTIILPRSTIETIARVDISNSSHQILIQEPVLFGISTFSNCFIDNYASSSAGQLLYMFSSSTSQLMTNIGQEVVLNYQETGRKAALRAILQGMVHVE